LIVPKQYVQGPQKNDSISESSDVIDVTNEVDQEVKLQKMS